MAARQRYAWAEYRLAALIDVSDTEWRFTIPLPAEPRVIAALIDVSDTEWRETPLSAAERLADAQHSLMSAILNGGLTNSLFQRRGL